MRKEANEFDVMGISPSTPVDMFLAITKLLGNRSGSTSHVLKYRKTSEPFGRLRERKWRTLEHNGVMFPPEYEPHRVKILYKRRPVHLNPDQEEVATMFAVMKDSDHVRKPVFRKNFWECWRQKLGAKHVIKGLDGCDFTAIHNWHQKEKARKKLKSLEQKRKMKLEKMELETKYMWAIVDGRKERVGNFRVEPPGLFCGRGEHPKMGTVKSRIRPENVCLNLGKEARIPKCPLRGHKWGEVRHDNTATWLAFYYDPLRKSDVKYVFLAACSSLKGQSDMEKYEMARTLGRHINKIRKLYNEDLKSKDLFRKELGAATYFIDRLAFRAGNEKSKDEAATVGCCSLKVEHVQCKPPRSLQFDFLGKDSIRYFKTVEVDKHVFQAIQYFRRGKKQGQKLFKLDTLKLNSHLRGFMPGLTAKVFRTFNASITLNTLLQRTSGDTVAEKLRHYQEANMKVAILCNHQRTVSKAHGTQMQKLKAQIVALERLLVNLQRQFRKGRIRKRPPRYSCKRQMALSPQVLRRKIAIATRQLKKARIAIGLKDGLKKVALNTSKINYMDPRITVAWCKRHQVPIQKVYNKALLAKFDWALREKPNFCY